MLVPKFYNPLLYLVFILQIVFLDNCVSPGEKGYKPKNLRQLTPEQMIDRAARKIAISPYVEFKDSLGNPLTTELKASLNKNELYTEQFVNKKDEVIEILVRTPTLEEEIIMLRIKEAYTAEAPRIHEVDCSEMKAILEKVYDKDQGIRSGDKTIPMSSNIDLENAAIVVSILERCPFASKSELGKKAVDAIFYVLQHSLSDIRARYYPYLKRLVENGDLEQGKLALVIDRMLVEHGKKQVYGSQVFKNRNTGNYELYPIRSPELVNQRRASVGLGTIEEYLKYWEVDFVKEVDKW